MPVTIGNEEAPTNSSYTAARNALINGSVTGNYGPKKVYEGQDITPMLNSESYSPGTQLNYNLDLAGSSRVLAIKQAANPLLQKNAIYKTLQKYV